MQSIARSSRRHIPPLAFRQVDGLWGAVDKAAAAGIEIRASRRYESWELQFSWEGEEFGSFRPAVETLIVAGQLRRFATLAEAMACVLFLIGGTEKQTPTPTSGLVQK